MPRYLVDKNFIENISLARKNLLKFKFEIPSETVFAVETDLSIENLSRIFLIPVGQIFENKRNFKGKTVELIEANFIEQDSLIEFFENLELVSYVRLDKNSLGSEQTSLESVEDNYLDISSSEIPTVVWREKSITAINEYIEGMLDGEAKSEVNETQQEKPGDQPTVVLNSDLMRLDSRTSVPKWHTSTDPKLNIELVENFISDLKRAKSLKLFQNDELLIFASLVASNRTNVFEELTPEISKNLDQFTEYLRNSYGLSLLDMRQALINLKQKVGESMHSFFARCVNLYYRSRNQEAPAINYITNDQVSKSDIVHYFISGLAREKVRTNLKMRLSSIKFEDLASTAREIDLALPADDQVVNLVEPSPHSIESLEKALENMVLRVSERMSRSRTPRRNVRFNNNRSSSRSRYNFRYNSRSKSRNRRDYSRSRGRKQNSDNKGRYKCYRCGRYGHLARWCRTKPTSEKYAK